MINPLPRYGGGFYFIVLVLLVGGAESRDPAPFLLITFYRKPFSVRQ
jgi:hypothetical protein